MESLLTVSIFIFLQTLESDYLSQTDDYKHDLDRHGNMRVPYSERSGRRDLGELRTRRLKV